MAELDAAAVVGSIAFAFASAATSGA